MDDISVGYVPPGIVPRTGFEHIIDELGWSKRDFAERLGLHENTVYRWDEAPDYALAYLRLMVGLKRLLG